MSAWAFCTERFQASEEESVFLGSDLIEWMVREGKCETEIEAQVKAAAMVSMGLFLPARDKRSSSYFEPDFYYMVNKVLDFGDDKPKVWLMVIVLCANVRLSVFLPLIRLMFLVLVSWTPGKALILYGRDIRKVSSSWVEISRISRMPVGTIDYIYKCVSNKVRVGTGQDFIWIEGLTT
jgi:hypothetical protein